MEIYIANIGLCWGIDRAYKKMAADANAFSDRRLYATHRLALPGTNRDLDTLGRIDRRDPATVSAYPGIEAIHVVEDHRSLSPGDTVLLGFHGVSRQEILDMNNNGIEIRDHKCSFIENLDSKVEKAVANGYNLIFVGKPATHHARHACQVANAGGKKCVVINSVNEFSAICRHPEERWALVGQVTGNSLVWGNVVEANKSAQLADIVLSTLCSDAFDRQAEALRLIQSCDAVLLVDDGGGGANSVADVLSTEDKPVFKLRWKEDESWKDGIISEWFRNVGVLGIVGGINVPSWSLIAVADHLKIFLSD